ncbi:MAG: very short patch repair endonuclease [Treponema sp.]|nr:very short patch repair endonuclease [Treponema sp.]
MRKSRAKGMTGGTERTPEITYKIMSAIKSKNTKPEMKLRGELWSRGLRYRVNFKLLKGKPDIVFTRAKLAVFCDGDFWHGHNWAIRGMPSLDAELEKYSKYWSIKILTNVERDKRVTRNLENEGWTVLRFWESDIKENVKSCADEIEAKYKKNLKNKD